MNRNEAIDFIRAEIERLLVAKAEQATNDNRPVVKRLAKEIRDKRTMLDSLLREQEEEESEGSR